MIPCSLIARAVFWLPWVDLASTGLGWHTDVSSIQQNIFWSLQWNSVYRSERQNVSSNHRVEHGNKFQSAGKDRLQTLLGNDELLLNVIIIP